MNSKIRMDKEKEVLFESLKDGGDVQYILDVAYKLLGNPIAMFDITYKLLANTENTVTDDPLWNELTTNGTFLHESVDFFITNAFVDVFAKSDVVAVMKSNKLKYERANGKIFDENGIQTANIIVIACYKPFADEDFAIIETICESLSIELQKIEAYRDRHAFPKTVIDHLLEEKDVENVELEDAVYTLYSDLKPNLYTAVVDITQYEPTLTHLVYFKELFERLQCEFKYFVYLNNIVIIISTDNAALSIEKDLKSLNEFFKKYKIFAGISSSFQNLFELHKYYKQALAALNYGIEDDNGENIFEYDNYRLEHFLNSVKNTRDINDLCNPLVFLIREYDKKNNSGYYNILRTYLLNGLDSRLVSEKLKMNHDELCGKLKNIEKIFELNLTSGNVLCSIFISMKVLANL